jgi:hypothetical protein
MMCTPQDTLGSILAFVREKRCHRFVIVEPEDVPPMEGRPGRKRGSLVGMLSLSDVLRFIVGHENLKGMEVPGLGASLSHASQLSFSEVFFDPSMLIPSTFKGVHGLRGVTSANSKATSGNETDVDSSSILETDGASSVGGSRTTSQRGSEAKNDAGAFGASELAAQLKQGLCLDDVVEGQAVE